MSSSDIADYLDRIETERALAQVADNKLVALIHEELARQYQARIDQPDQYPKLRLVLPG